MHVSAGGFSATLASDTAEPVLDYAHDYCTHMALAPIWEPDSAVSGVHWCRSQLHIDYLIISMSCACCLGSDKRAAKWGWSVFLRAIHGRMAMYCPLS